MVVIVHWSKLMLILDKYKFNQSIVQTDSEYLVEQIQHIRDIFSNETIALKNTNLEYLAFSRMFADTFGFDERILDSANDLDPSNKSQREVIGLERQVILNKVANDSTYQFKLDKQTNIYLMRRRPLINPSTNNCVGILIIARRIDPAVNRRVILKYFMGKSEVGMSEPLTTEVTEYQQQIINCMLLGFYQRKEIALMLKNMTNVESSEWQIKRQIQDLYQKFRCNSPSELINLITTQQKGIL